MEPHDIEAKTFPIGRRGYDKEAVDAFLHQVAAEHRSLQEMAASVITPAQPAVPTFENVGSQVSAILESAARAAEELKAAAARDADAVRDAALQETASARQAAADRLADADQIRAAADQEAADIVTAAREEAARLHQEALATAGEVEREANDRASELQRTVQESVEAMLTEGRRQYERVREVREQAAEHLAAAESMIHDARAELSDEPAREAFQAARHAVLAARRNGPPAAAGSEEPPRAAKRVRGSAGASREPAGAGRAGRSGQARKG